MREYTADRPVVALAGGVGGAKLVDGLAAVLPPDAFTAIVNTGDDFEHWGLWVSPDLDTVSYTLAGLAHPEQGWGLAGESFHAMEMMSRYGGDAWFALGDRDLSTHLRRTMLLRQGRRLTEVTRDLCRALGVPCRVLPMADARRPTIIESDAGETLGFQDWLVRRRAEPRVRAVRFEGASQPSPEALDAIERAAVIVLCPSNPYVSIDPILSLEGVRAAVAARPVIAVSPIVHGRAVKGPLAAMIETLAGRAPGADAVAAHYGRLLTGMVVERGDERGIEAPVRGAATVMKDRAHRAALAREVLAFAEALA